MTTSLQAFAVTMAPANQEWWWYWGRTGEQVGQLLAQNRAMLTDISPYIDVDNTLKFAVIMAPANQEWWWYWGQTGEQVGQLLAQNRAMLTDISPYIDVDNTLKFAVIMAPANQEWWWYWGQTGEQVGQLLAQNRAMLTDISPYIDVDNTLKFAVIMAPANQEWWWYWGRTGEQVGQLLAQNRAMLTDISPYIDVDNTLKFAVIMAPANQEWWWYWGQISDQITEQLAANNARLTKLRLYRQPGALTGLQMQYQQMSNWCWIAVSTSISHYYNPASTWTQCSLTTAQLQASASLHMQGQCCPDAQLIASTPGLAQKLADPYSSSSEYALDGVNSQLAATPENICNHTGDIAKALTQTGNLSRDTGSVAGITDLLNELSAGRPVCIGITWSGGGGHYIAAIGVELPDTVIVKDPVNGLSVLPYQTLVSSYLGNGSWTDSLYTQP